MPQRVVCHKCQALLYEGEELKSPHDLIQEYDGKCPNCGRKLLYVPKTVKVEPVEATV